MGDRELRQIFEGQNRIHLEIKQLNRQLDMILDEQRKYVSSLTEELSKRGAGLPGQHGQVSPLRCGCAWLAFDGGEVRRTAAELHVPVEGDYRAGWPSFVSPPDHSTRTGHCCEHSA